MDKVVLINPFEVPAGEEAAALRFWEQVARLFALRRHPSSASSGICGIKRPKHWRA